MLAHMLILMPMVRNVCGGLQVWWGASNAWQLAVSIGL